MSRHRIERAGKSGGVSSRSYNPGVRSVRTGIDGVGVECRRFERVTFDVAPLPAA